MYKKAKSIVAMVGLMIAITVLTAACGACEKDWNGVEQPGCESASVTLFEF